MIRKRKSKLECLKQVRVIRLEPITLDGERFMPYCNSEQHRGISLTYRMCEDVMCKHFKRLYIE